MNALSPFRLTGVTLEERVHVRRTREIEHEREIALYDLLEANSFKLVGSSGGPYKLVLGIEERRLTFDIHLENGEPHGKLILSLTPFRRAIKEYFQICESYFKSIPNDPSTRIESLDMARRGLHNDGAELLMERLKGKVEMDFDTARRLFTLICVLHLKG
jgi:uncharacterized protein (UPF0262 family)